MRDSNGKNPILVGAEAGGEIGSGFGPEGTIAGGIIGGLVGLAALGVLAISSSSSDSKPVDLTIDTPKQSDDSTVNLYRAMGYVEYGRFIKYGRFAIDEHFMETKWFATNSIDANILGKKMNPYGYKVVEITIPKKALACMYYNPHLDGIGQCNCTIY